MLLFACEDKEVKNIVQSDTTFNEESCVLRKVLISKELSLFSPFFLISPSLLLTPSSFLPSVASSFPFLLSPSLPFLLFFLPPFSPLFPLSPSNVSIGMQQFFRESVKLLAIFREYFFSHSSYTFHYTDGQEVTLFQIHLVFQRNFDFAASVRCYNCYCGRQLINC